MSSPPAKGNSSHQLRRLLPAARSSTGPAIPTYTGVAVAKHARNQVSAACISCRRLKVKCSGERPICSRCAERRIECRYTTKLGETEAQARTRSHRDLRSRVSTHAELLELLLGLPEQDVHDVLQRLRTGSDIAAVINQIKTGDLLVQMAVKPEIRFRYDFPYRSEMPEDLIADNPYLDSPLYEVVSLGVTAKARQAPQTHRNSSDDHENLYLKPFHAAEVVDPRLANVMLSSWTAACDNDVLMRDILATWLRCEYQFTAAFQKDLFLEDAAAHREDFCSSLLVNIVLGYACVCYPRFSNRAQYWDPDTLMYRFVAEARRLWELESSKPRLTTIQAGILFNVYYNLCGLDAVGQAYRLQAIALAHELQLFDASKTSLSDRHRHGTAFTAWSLFNWETFSFMFAPLLRQPPQWNLPSPVEGADFYGEIWVHYPLTDRLLPSYFGHVVQARSQFRIIMNSYCQAAYIDGPITSAKAYEFLTDLQRWHGGLSEPLSPRAIVLPGHLQLHMYYYHLILTIFEPLSEDSAGKEGEVPAEQIVADAKKLMETLMRLYYLRHGYEAMDLFIVIPLMLAASESIDAIESEASNARLESLRSTLILVTKGLHSQRRNHFLAEALFRVIRGRMRPSEVALLKGVINLDDEVATENPEMAQAVRSAWPVSVVKKREDMDSYILTNLVENYAHLNAEGNGSAHGTQASEHEEGVKPPDPL